MGWLLLLSLLAGLACVQAQTEYVHPDGSGTDCSRTQPCSFNTALARLRAAVKPVISMAGGVYYVQNTTIDFGVGVRADPESIEPVVIAPASDNDRALFQIGTCTGEFQRWQGITFRAHTFPIFRINSAEPCPLTITSCVFTENKDRLIWHSTNPTVPYTLELSSTAFISNVMQGNARSFILWRQPLSTLEVRQCSFVGNVFDEFLIDASVSDASKINTVNLGNNLFSNNGKRGTNGRSLVFFNSSGTLNVRDCIFEDNTGQGGGSAFSVASQGNVTFQQSLFRNNVAYKGFLPGPIKGGAIYITQPQMLSANIQVSVERCAFRNNSVDSADGAIGGAIAVERREGGPLERVVLDVVKSEFKQNRVGGGVLQLELGGAIGAESTNLVDLGVQQSIFCENLNSTGTTFDFANFNSTIGQTVTGSSYFRPDSLEDQVCLLDPNALANIEQTLVVLAGPVDSFNGTARVSGRVTRVGSLIFNRTAQLQVGQGDGVDVQQTLTVEAGAIVELNVTGSGTFVILTFATYSGDPLELRTTLGDSVCEGATVTSSLQYAPTSVSVLVNVDETTCGQQPSPPPPGGDTLSTGAIVGIAVGAVVGGLLLAVVIVLIIRRATVVRTQRMRREIQLTELD